MVDIGWFLLGTLVLLLGTDSLAKGLAAAFAHRAAHGHAFALGASALNAIVPAAAVLVAAIVADARPLALGSLVGGAIGQLGLVLGVAALVAPLRVRLKAFAHINPALVLAVVLLGVLAFDGVLSAIDAILLGLATLIVIGVLIRDVRGERVAARELFAGEGPVVGAGLLGVRIVVGIALAALGAWLLVRAAIGLASAMEWSTLIVGLLVVGPVAALAGLPGALASARRGHGDFAVGQVLLGALANVLPLPALLVLCGSLATGAALWKVEIPALLALALAVYPMMRSDGELTRREGGVLLAVFAAYLVVEALLLIA